MSKFREGFVYVQDVPTHVLTFGCWVTDTTPLADAKFIVLVFPGNPGMIGFYKEFMATIYDLLGGEVPVWGVSHAGHVKPAKNLECPPLNGNDDVYGLYGQVEHKVSFIERYVPSDVSIILVGHSIGTFISLKVMSSAVGSQVIKSILLFPALENLALSSNGRWATPLLTFFQPLATVVVHLLSYLSERIQFKVIQWFFKGRAVPDCALQTSLNIFDPLCTKMWMFMAYQEMILVKDLDYDDVARHIDDLILYYGTHDEWCPLSFYYAMKDRFPTKNVILCDKGFEHAFILQSSKEVGELVANWIGEIQKQYWVD